MPKLKRISLSSSALMGVVALALVLCLSWGSVARADVITRTVGITTVFPEQYDSLSRRAVPFPMPEDGTITSVAMFHDGGSGGMILAVYDNGGDNKPNNRTAITAETATDPSAGWQTIDLITPVEVSTGAKIWLAWVYENEITHRVGGCDPGWGRAKTSSPAKYWADTPRMPATFGSCELGHNGTSSIYANYTPGGGPPDTDPPEPDGFVPYIRLDRVNYSDGSHPENFHELPGDPWPTDPDGGGKSLSRIDVESYGNDPANWQSAAATPGW